MKGYEMSQYQWQKAAASIFFPQRNCLNCDQLAIEKPLCQNCTQLMEELKHCPHCASFVASTETKHYLCRDCRKKFPSFLEAQAALPYEGRLRDILIAFKYKQKTGYHRSLAALLYKQFHECFESIPFDAIVPVPLHEERLKERGYNQSELLSRVFAAQTGLSHQPSLMVRTGDTPPLASLGRKERMRVLRGVFSARSEVAGKNILLIDDIFTSGATAEMCSRALLAQKAASVYILCVAAGRALP